MGSRLLAWKSYADHLLGPVRSYTHETQPLPRAASLMHTTPVRMPRSDPRDIVYGSVNKYIGKMAGQFPLFFEA